MLGTSQNKRCLLRGKKFVTFGFSDHVVADRVRHVVTPSYLHGSDAFTFLCAPDNFIRVYNPEKTLTSLPGSKIRRDSRREKN